MAGTGAPSAAAIPESKTTAASAPRSSPRIHSVTSPEPASSSPSTRTRTLTGSSPARESPSAACSSGQKLPLSSDAPRAQTRPSRTSGSNGGTRHAVGSPTDWTS
jgi:hypothetical protein